MNHLQLIKGCLSKIGYHADCISDSVGLWTGQGQVALVAHSRPPKDIRTAAFVVYDGSLGQPDAFEKVRATGAAIAIGVAGDNWQTSRIDNHGFWPIQQGKLHELTAFFRKNAASMAPDAVYRAKAWGRIDPSVRQLDFVDSGLMPVVESEMGRRISQLLEECVRTLAGDLGWRHLGESRAEEKKAEWLIQAPFWLLAAKALRDKRVPGFIRLDLSEFDTVFAKLAKHYSSDESRAVQVPKNRSRALERVARQIEEFAPLDLLSAEALGHVYESTLINKATRRKLGTHSTPPWLIDYIVGKLRPWIAEIPEHERYVFEPACGHAGFLVAALRLLDELRTPDSPEPRNTYLRKRLSGVDVDAFSQEVARLALTLADVPNPNGWHLVPDDMFASDVIERESSKARIVLLNPPFESFGSSGRKGWLPNKAAETLRRVVENLPAGGVLGFVGPQGILQNKQGREIRRQLLQQFEIQEVVLFADKVFEYGAPESTVILARRRASSRKPLSLSINFARVREGDIKLFSLTQQASSIETISTDELLNQSDRPLFVPELGEIWSELTKAGNPMIGKLTEMGQGLTHIGAGDFPTEKSEPFPGSLPGFAGWSESQLTHELPEIRHLNVEASAIYRERMGLDSHPHILLNYAPVSRGPWRLKALIDEEGHPVTSRFIVVRPRNTGLSLPTLWALLNSPIANAFTYCHLGKRDNLVGALREMPVPDMNGEDGKKLHELANAYLTAAHRWSAAKSAEKDEEDMPLFRSKATRKTRATPPTEDELRILHLRVDAEVMRLYGLPPGLERRILGLFEDEPRKGVPFDQTGYFPRDFEGLNTVSELVAVLADWAPLAERKTELIRRKAERRATTAELRELTELKRLSAARRDLLAPLPVAEAKALYEQVVKRAAMPRET